PARRTGRTRWGCTGYGSPPSTGCGYGSATSRPWTARRSSTSSRCSPAGADAAGHRPPVPASVRSPAVPEGEMPVGVAGDVEPVGLVKDGRVAVGRQQHRDDDLPAGHHRVTQTEVRRGVPGERPVEGPL